VSGKPDLSVVLPTLDESDGLKVLLPRLQALFEKLGVTGEILVVDGGSKDDTAAVAEANGARVMRQQARGFGSAVREGIAAAAADSVALMDADGSHAPEALEAFWMRRHDAALIVGSRYCRGGSAQMDMTRQVLSRSLNLVSRRVLDLPVRESSSGFRLYSGPAARAVRSGATDFSVQQDLMVGILAAGGRVIELPIHYAPRVGGVSKANAWKLAPAYVRLLLRLKPRRGGWKMEAGLALALAGAACAGYSDLGGAAAAFWLAAGALCVHETIRLRGDRLAGALAAAAWPCAALAGAPLAAPRAALWALAVFLAAAVADSVFP
jgi:dolichol-phosphate mannosyltransferase